MVLYDCLIKTKHFAKTKINVQSVSSALYRQDIVFYLVYQYQDLIESPINGGLNYKGPKVAEYLGR